MKNLRYLFLVCLTWMILGSCGEEYVYNTRVVTGVDLLDVGEEGNLLFSRGENGEIKVRITPVDANDTGGIRALAVGEATLTVQAINNPAVSQCCKVVVQPNWIRTIELPQEYKDCSLLVDSKIDLGSVITIKPEQVDNPDVIYTSSNPNIATVSEDGIVTGVSSGSVEIVIQAADQGGAVVSAFIN